MLGTCSWTKIKGEEGRGAEAELEEQSRVFLMPFRNWLPGTTEKWVQGTRRRGQGAVLTDGAG